jgi:hypothetical protein
MRPDLYEGGGWASFREGVKIEVPGLPPRPDMILARTWDAEAVAGWERVIAYLEYLESKDEECRKAA